MLLLRKRVQCIRLVAALAGGTFLSACMKWETQSLQPERFRGADSTQAMRLVLDSGDTLIVHGPVMVGDSLVGMQTRPGASPDSLERVRIPLTALRQAEVRQHDAAATAVVGGLGLVAVIAIIAARNPCYGICSH